MATRSWALLVVLAVALGVRLWAMLTQTYVIFADETFQYLEQGHRLAFGDGIVPWEYHDGIRSWLLPGAIAALMHGGAWLDDGAEVYLRLVRGACVLLSLSVVWVGFRVGERRGGLAPALLAGGFAALWFDLVWFAPVVLTETVAAHLVIMAIGLSDGHGADSRTRTRGERPTARPGLGDQAGGRRWVPRLDMAADVGTPDPSVGPQAPRAAAAATQPGHLSSMTMIGIGGALFGLAVCLRYQYAPAIAVIALWQYRLDWHRWRAALIGGLAVGIMAGGLLDWATWGLPFQSIWLHFLRNTVDGVGSAIGTDPPSYYLAYLLVALWPAPLLLALAVIGATRAPALGLAALVTVLVHTVVPHKEVRFIYLALAVTPILIGLGIAALLARVGRPHPAWSGGALAVWAWLSWQGATGSALVDRWTLNRSSVEIFLAASRLPALCGLAVRDMRLIDSGGYVYLHRDVPLFFADATDVFRLPGSAVTLRFSVERHRQAEPLRAIPAAGGFNALIGTEAAAPAGFTRLGCRDDPSRTGAGALCLFHDASRRCDGPGP